MESKMNSKVMTTCLPFAMIAGCALLLGSAESSATEATVTFEKERIHDAAPNNVISLGDKALSGKDYSGAMKQYQEAANDKDTKIRASAWNRIGELYGWGLGVRKDYVQSFSWYQKAALLGNPYAQAHLGNYFFSASE
jgi:TPR repeat protein